MSSPVTPEVLWAQRSSSNEAAKNIIYLTISVPDVSTSDIKLDVKSQSLSFTGRSSSLKRDYHVDLEFFDEIDTDATKINHTSKNVELVLRKKELKEEYWPRLIKENKKLHFLKTDFDKWVDEDEQDGIPEDNFANMGGMGGMPGMGDMSSMMGGGGGDFGGIDFSKLGGGMGEDDVDGEEDDDEEMPALDGDDEKDSADISKSAATPEPAESSSKAKIEEVS